MSYLRGEEGGQGQTYNLDQLAIRVQSELRWVLRDRRRGMRPAQGHRTLLRNMRQGRKQEGRTNREGEEKHSEIVLKSSSSSKFCT